MPRYTYHNNPALRPTVLIQEVMKTVYRPSLHRAMRETAGDVPAGDEGRAATAGDDERAHPRAA